MFPFRRRASIALQAIVSFYMCLAQAAPLPDAPQAQLRCDPGVAVRSVDGEASKGAANPAGETDCRIPVDPGPHTVAAGFFWDVGDLTNYRWARIDEPVTLQFEAAEGRIYRVRYRVDPDQKAWIEDVTDEERGLPSHEPFAPVAKDIPKTQRKSTVIARIAPAYTEILLKPGRTSGVFFQDTGYGPWLRPKKGTTYAIGRVNAGETAGFVFVNYRGKGLSMPAQMNACDAVHVPVYENVPGGQVLYLGRFEIEAVAGGYVLHFSQGDLEAVRAELAVEHPALARELRAASFRMARVAEPCLPIKRWLLHRLLESSQ